MNDRRVHDRRHTPSHTERIAVVETEMRNLKTEVTALRVSVDSLKKSTWEQTGAIAAIVLIVQIAMRFL